MLRAGKAVWKLDDPAAMREEIAERAAAAASAARKKLEGAVERKATEIKKLEGIAALPSIQVGAGGRVGQAPGCGPGACTSERVLHVLCCLVTLAMCGVRFAGRIRQTDAGSIEVPGYPRSQRMSVRRRRCPTSTASSTRPQGSPPTTRRATRWTARWAVRC